MKLIVVAQFEANRKYIAQYLCEHRNKPELDCKGKCYLKEKLESEEKNESANNVLKIKIESLFVQEIVSPVFTFYPLPEKPIYTYLSFESFTCLKEKLQPPEIKNGVSV